MSPQQWQHVNSLFEAALERDENQRAEFVKRCPDDPDVRDEVLRLLREHASMDSGFLAPPGRETLLDGVVRALAANSTAGYQGQLLAGRYFVEREIGRGGSGVVYLAQDRELHSRPVVIKFLQAPWENHERVRLKFRQEIEALSRINHPAVVGVLNVGQAPDGRSFLVMEYVEGVTLRSRLREGRLSFAEVDAIAATLCDALESAHRSGIVHRDIKPENIILPAAGENMAAAKLIDFGIAKVHNSSYDANTETVTVVGTIRYVAPEQLMGRAAPQSDIYALGAVCYEMLTGCHPFEPDTPFQLYELQKAGKVTPPSKLCKGVPKSADLAILRALSFRSEDRQASARQFARDFRAPSGRRWLGPRSWLWAAFALLLLLIAAGWRVRNRAWGSYENVIEFAGGRDPEDFGFRSRLDLTEHAVYNPERTGYDAIRLLSDDQGYYYRKLTHAQAYAAMRKGWKLEATMKPFEGQGCAGIELTPAGIRYSVCVMRNPLHRQVVQLTTRLEKGIDGPTYELSGPEDAWHDYQLIFNPRAQTGRLLVDGVERLRDYCGFSEYLEGWGLTFSTALYKSSRAETMFKRVHFEINP
jgi:predicted Ser/Thr protein kinase